MNLRSKSDTKNIIFEINVWSQAINFLLTNLTLEKLSCVGVLVHASKVFKPFSLMMP